MTQIDYQSLETPCFILDRSEFVKSIDGFKHALNSRFQSSVLGYSVKTNSLPYLLKLACNNGLYAEVVSHDEYNLALACGFPEDRIIYNGPLKSKETFLNAIIHGAFVNIECKRELDWLKNLPQDREFNIGIRLNVNISRISTEDADGENDNSRFGFSDETEEFGNAVRFIKELPNVKLTGLHIHRTSHSRSVTFYKRSIQYASDVIKKYQLGLTYLDVGGGYFGIFKNKPTYQEYCDAFYEILKNNQLDNLTVIVEPGNGLVASTFSFLSEVIDVKHTEPSRYFITTDGSRNDIDPFFHKTDYIKELIYTDSKTERESVPVQIVSGGTCLEYDRMFTLENSPLLQVDDRILYKNVGAYTMCLSPLFIRYIPNVYLNDNGHISLIREKWTEKEYINKSII